METFALMILVGLVLAWLLLRGQSMTWPSNEMDDIKGWLNSDPK